MRWLSLSVLPKNVRSTALFNTTLAIIKYMCAELGASKEKKTIIKGQHSYEVLLKILDK
jgi:hypothetical protein